MIWGLRLIWDGNEQNLWYEKLYMFSVCISNRKRFLSFCHIWDHATNNLNLLKDIFVFLQCQCQFFYHVVETSLWFCVYILRNIFQGISWNKKKLMNFTFIGSLFVCLCLCFWVLYFRADEEPVDQKRLLEDLCKPKCVKPLFEYQVNHAGEAIQLSFYLFLTIFHIKKNVAGFFFLW